MHIYQIPENWQNLGYIAIWTPYFGTIKSLDAFCGTIFTLLYSLDHVTSTHLSEDSDLYQSRKLAIITMLF